MRFFPGGEYADRYFFITTNFSGYVLDKQKSNENRLC